MAIIYGTEGNDDGTVSPMLVSSVIPSTIFALEGDDILVSSSRPFDTTPDMLYGGFGNDLYKISPLGYYFIYSTPVIWVPFAGDVVIHEENIASDSADRIDLTDAGYDVQTSASFDGKDIVIQAFARTIRLVDNYAVDTVGNLLAGVDLVTMAIYGPPPPDSTVDAVVSIQTMDLKQQSTEFDFIRSGTSAADVLQGDGVANVMTGGAGKDTLRGGGGDDFLAGGAGADKLYGDDGDDRLFGGDAADRLEGGAGDDSLDGMRGNDRLLGGTGNDTYIHSGKGSGFDTIDDAAGAADAIAFGHGVTFAQLVFAQVGPDLSISIAGLKNTGVRIINQVGTGRIETLLFADGTTHDLGSLYNRAPVAAADALLAVAGRTTGFDLFADNGGGADTDPDGDPFFAMAGTYATSAGGTVSISADGLAGYTPRAGFVGEDSFTYRIADSFGAHADGTATIMVSGNRAPVATPDRFAGLEDRILRGNVLADNGGGVDGDPDRDAVSVVARTFTTANGGTVNLAADGGFTFAPVANWNGLDAFAYEISDGYGGTAAGAVEIVVAPVNDSPRAVADSFAIDAARPFTGNLLGNDSDPDGNPLTARPASFVTSAGSAITIATDGVFTFVNLGGHLTQDVFTYTIEDGQGAAATAQVMISLRAPAGAVVGTASDDILVGTASRDIVFGQSGKDDIFGGGGADRLFGGDLDDDVAGGEGDDSLFGGQGDDKLQGGGGNDYLHGGAGADDLEGEEGADTFAFTALGDGADEIRDFSRSEGDVLDLHRTLLVDFDPSLHRVIDFVRITEAGASSLLAIDPDGTAGQFTFTTLATLLTTTGLTDEQALFDEGLIIL